MKNIIGFLCIFAFFFIILSAWAHRVGVAETLRAFGFAVGATVLVFIGVWLIAEDWG